MEIRVLRRQGKSIREIARMLDVSRNTVRRYVRSEGPARYEREARPSKLDDYKPYIAERARSFRPALSQESMTRMAPGRLSCSAGTPA